MLFVVAVAILCWVVSSCNKEVLQLDSNNTVVGNTATNTFNIVPTDWTLNIDSQDSVGYYYPVFMANMNPVMPYGTFLYGIQDTTFVTDSAGNKSYYIDETTKDTVRWTSIKTLNIDTLSISMKLLNGNYIQLDSNYTAQLNNIKYSFNYRGYDSTIFIRCLKTGITDTTTSRYTLTDTLTAQLIFKQVPSANVTSK
ncbi:hypothetical protein [Rhizosphaericola mali]|uniref:Uncharacterized protein n=1 Tax=Rhizosphaericola mali TaxID=2545455 RepID=A0A5P2G0J3_9BACT|nr:hypothetical protein [Rhizosphaericola mali]QES88178.1 hypothetical protein E0W69_005685 [Rhizosphaericola mali]